MKCEGETVNAATIDAIERQHRPTASRPPGGDGYTATFVLVDEADLVPDFNHHARGAPTIDAGGKLFLVSRAKRIREQAGKRAKQLEFIRPSARRHGSADIQQQTGALDETATGHTSRRLPCRQGSSDRALKAEKG